MPDVPARLSEVYDRSAEHKSMELGPLAILRLRLDDASVDRVSDLGVRLEPILRDFTADEIRAHLRAHDAATEGDSY